MTVSFEVICVIGWVQLREGVSTILGPLSFTELDYDIIFAIAAKAKMPYVGIELDQPATLEQAIENHKKSVAYLKGKFGG